LIDALATGGALFFRDIADRVGVGASHSPVATDAELLEVLWDLVWSGWVTNDGWTALRAHIGGTGAKRPPSGRRPGLPSRSGPPAGSGRWSLLADASADPAASAMATASALLDRHGIVTRGTVVSERIDGGFARMYRVLTAFEDAGRCQRTYAVEGLGAAQFALPTAVDRVRATSVRERRGQRGVVVLAATDPANAYGAALPWPALAVDDVTHRPGRKAGAVVVLVDGSPVLYLERGGKSLLTWPADPEALEVAASALAQRAHAVGADRAIVTRVDGSAPGDEIARVLLGAGFLPTPRGLRAPRA
jgi:ATP-dependent Lhr-like helicase